MTFLRDPQARRAVSTRMGGDRGATAVEYALLVAGVAIVMILGVAFLGSSLNSGVASAAEALSGGGQSVAGGQPVAGEQSVAGVEQAAPEPVAPEQAAANVRSCTGQAVAAGRRNLSPSCDTTTGEWTCPRGYDLDRVSGRGNGSVYTCEED
jgi:Flp pilus assembly pilin Flp